MRSNCTLTSRLRAAAVLMATVAHSTSLARLLGLRGLPIRPGQAALHKAAAGRGSPALGWAFAGVALIAAALTPATTYADPDESVSLGPYIALDLGYHWPLTIDAHSLSPAPDGLPFNWNYKLNSDWASFGRVGYRFAEHFRIELDAGLRESNINSIEAPGGSVNGFSALRPQEPAQLCDHTNAPPPCSKIGQPHINWAYADDGMVNVLYDLWPTKRLQPFFGAGAGIYHLQFDAHFFFSGVPGAITATNPAVQQLQLGGSTDHFTQFAYQGIGGLSYRLKHRLWFDLTYRYIEAPFLRWNTLNDTPGLTQTEGLQPHDFRGAAQDMSVTAGVRYSL
jgi:OOP family OmpA-OmpF porin